MVWEQDKKNKQLQEWLVLCDVLRDPSTLQVRFRTPHGLFGRVDCDIIRIRQLGGFMMYFYVCLFCCGTITLNEFCYMHISYFYD